MKRWLGLLALIGVPCQICVASDTCGPSDVDWKCQNAARGFGSTGCENSQTPPACWVCTQSGSAC